MQYKRISADCHLDMIWLYVAKQFGHLPADVTHKITCENAGKFYGLIN